MGIPPPPSVGGVRFACGIFNVVLGVLLLASGHWLGSLTWLAAVPLAGAALIFWTVYRLQQDSVRRVRELEQSRAHVVDDSAARLRRIERDLHDGAQAQMVAVAMKLGLAREKLGGMVAGTGQADLERVLELVDAAHRGAKEAITELRDLARGIHPPVLDHGLGAALDHPRRAQRRAGRAGRRSARAPVGRDRDHRLLLRRRTAHQRRQAQRRPACHAGGGARARAAPGAGQRRRRRRRPHRGRAAAWPGWPSGSGPWMARCRSAARPEAPRWSPSSCRRTPDRTGARRCGS